MLTSNTTLLHRSSDFSTTALMMNANGHTGAVLSLRLRTASADAASIKAKVDLTAVRDAEKMEEMAFTLPDSSSWQRASCAGMRAESLNVEQHQGPLAGGGCQSTAHIQSMWGSVDENTSRMILSSGSTLKITGNHTTTISFPHKSKLAHDNVAITPGIRLAAVGTFGQSDAAPRNAPVDQLYAENITSAGRTGRCHSALLDCAQRMSCGKTLKPQRFCCAVVLLPHPYFPLSASQSGSHADLLSLNSSCDCE